MKRLSHAGYLSLTLMLVVATAEQALAAAPTPTDPTGDAGDAMGLLPGTFPTTVTAANMKVEQFVPAVMADNNGGSNNLRISFPAAGPIKWTESRHNEGDIALLIGPGDPNNPDYFPPTTFVDDYGPIQNAGQLFEETTIAWRVNQRTGAALATVNHNGVDYGPTYTFSGQPVGTIHGIAYFNQTAAGGWGYRMSDGVFANGGEGSTDLQMGIAGFDSGQGESSSSAAVSYFPYEQGWIGAWVNGADNGEATFGSSSPGLPTSTVNWSSGLATVSLDGVDSATDGMLFVASSSDANSTNIAASFSSDGGWKVAMRPDDSADFSGTTLNSGAGNNFQFLYVPYDAPRLIGGHVNGGDASLITSAGDAFFDVTRSAQGEYALSVFDRDGETKLSGDDGMLILSVADDIDDAEALPERKFLSYEYNADTGNFEVQSRELTAVNSPNTENQFGDELSLEDVDFYFAWVSFANPLTALPGDFSGDGKVDAADYVSWRKTDGTPEGFAQLRANFGNAVDLGEGAALPATVNTAVPEPGTLGLIGSLLGSLACAARRSSRRLAA